MCCEGKWAFLYEKRLHDEKKGIRDEKENI